ncbi:MAG: hypothetical protein ABI745_00740 [Caldimonas sp.]
MSHRKNPAAHRRVPRGPQRGVAALVVTLLLCVSMILAVSFAQRDIAAEERRSADDYRTAQAFEAAEAGLEWALARVDDPTRIDARCLPSADPTARPWRERMLRLDAPTGTFVPATWIDAGVTTPLRSACVRDAAGWHCSCPSDGRAELPAIEGPATAPAFTIELAAGPRAGLVRVVAGGCTRFDASEGCATIPSLDREAAARHEAIWAWVPALRSPPSAALTARGDVLVGAAALGVGNVDRASAGLALHAGGRVEATSLRLIAPSGSSLGASIASGDAELAALSADRFFARRFGMEPEAWSRQPGLARLACADDCAAAIAAAIDAGRRRIYIDGDLELAGPLQLGSAAEPVVLVASGAIRLRAGIEIAGLVYGDSLAWNDAPVGSASIRGAALVAGGYRGDGAPDLVHDDAVLSLLKTREGSFVRVNGSWKDF